VTDCKENFDGGPVWDRFQGLPPFRRNYANIRPTWIPSVVGRQ
jgi:hypothetical protein